MIQVQTIVPSVVRESPNNFVRKECSVCKKVFWCKTRKSRIIPKDIKRWNAVTCCRECSIINARNRMREKNRERRRLERLMEKAK